MRTFEYKGKSYEVDEDDFLIHPDQWDPDFAEGMAPRSGIHDGLTDIHWAILKYIRKVFADTGECPMVHRTCMVHKLRSLDLARLFPAGYRRGACKLAGLSYLADDILLPCYRSQKAAMPSRPPEENKVYRVDVRGFLVDPAEWDENFAVFKSREMKMFDCLEKKHWQLIRYMRDKYAKTGGIPTVYEACADNDIEIDELGRLFPDGYHRGLIKLSGLRG